jgi:hypothetical protein
MTRQSQTLWAKTNGNRESQICRHATKPVRFKNEYLFPSADVLTIMHHRKTIPGVPDYQLCTVRAVHTHSSTYITRSFDLTLGVRHPQRRSQRMKGACRQTRHHPRLQLQDTLIQQNERLSSRLVHASVLTDVLDSFIHT